MQRSAANAYSSNKLSTATPGDLTLMLYNGAIKYCNLAIDALKKRDYAQCNDNIHKTKNIIVHFREQLDRKYEVAKDFDIIYDYIYWVLTQANINKDMSMLEEALNRIREMRDTWTDVMRIAKKESGNHIQQV
jgi:flagellar protein FliS